jgi:CIC family chloride channel protein
MALGTAIGIVAGLGAVVFYEGIQFVTAQVLGRIVGYLPPAPVGEGTTGLLPIGRPWLLPIVTALGGLLSGIIVFSLAPEAEGHGTDAAIEAIHHKGGRIRARIPPIKLIASAITIGSGGSGGREGPAAQISAGFGSLMGQWLKLDAQDRRIAVSAGIGAGIGAIFRAPLGGAVLAAEILYTHDLEVEAIIPALIASIVGYAIYGAYFGYAPIFGPHTGLALGSPVQLVYYAALGVLCGLVGVLYARSFYGIGEVFHRLRLPRSIKPAIGGLLVGLMGLVLPGALHMGYGWVQIAMGPGLLSLPLWVVLLLPFAKILSTGLSIGSGGSGGIFGPGMVIGGMLGASFWRLAHDVLPGMPPQPTAFVIIGMMALFGGIAHAPLAVMLMVAEMTGNLSLLAPAMVAVAVSTALVGNNTIYRSQIPNRAHSPAHRLQFSFPLLSSLQVRDAMMPPGPIIRANSTLSSAEAVLGDERNGVVVLNAGSQEFAGIVTPAVLLQVPPGDRARTPVRSALIPDPVVLSPEDGLDAALEHLAEADVSWAPVVEDRRLQGELHVRDAIHTYKTMLQRGVSRATGLPAHISHFEVRVSEGSALAGRTLAEAALPHGTLVLSITRDGETLFPLATTRMEAGDVVMVVADRTNERQLRAFLEGAAAQG